MKIPLEKLTIRASRSGGPGGQNVNKVSSRVEVRFSLDSADWIPARVRKRLRDLYPRRITREGDFHVVSSRFRTQGQNLKDCLDKIAQFLQAAAKRPRRRIPTSPTRASREKRISGKRHHSRIKRERATKYDRD